MSLPLTDLIVAEDGIIYNVVAASMFTFWDHCITFDQEEVELVWRSRWSLISVVFLVVRYMTLFVRIVELFFYADLTGIIHPSLSKCYAWLRFEASSGQIIFVCVEILLVMRVFAFYGRKRLVLAGLITLFLCENVARMTILGLTMPEIVIVQKTQFAIPPNIHAGDCIITGDPGLFSNYWVPALIFESILFLLIIARFIQTRRHAELDSPHILVVFIRDDVWAFTLTFAVLMWAALSFELSPVKGDVALTWLYSVLGFCGSRLVLNLRSAAVECPELTSEEGVELNFHKSAMETGTSETCSAMENESKMIF